MKGEKGIMKKGAHNIVMEEGIKRWECQASKVDDVTQARNRDDESARF